jgi:hypothetical protein
MKQRLVQHVCYFMKQKQTVSSRTTCSPAHLNFLVTLVLELITLSAPCISSLPHVVIFWIPYDYFAVSQKCLYLFFRGFVVVLLDFRIKEAKPAKRFIKWLLFWICLAVSWNNKPFRQNPYSCTHKNLFVAWHPGYWRLAYRADIKSPIMDHAPLLMKSCVNNYRYVVHILSNFIV